MVVSERMSAEEEAEIRSRIAYQIYLLMPQARALLAELDATRRERDEALKFVRNDGKHQYPCPKGDPYWDWRVPPPACTCGLDGLLSDLAARDATQ